MGNFIITAEAGGPSSGGGSGGTAPDAPAVIASWISGVEPIYLRYGNAWKVSGFQGTITPPSGTDCTYLQQIHVTAKSPDGAKSEISVPGPFAESTAVQFAVGTDYLLEADATFTLSFASENDDSKLTAPYNLTYIVHAATITLLAGADAWSGSGVPTTSQRWKDSSGAVHGVITATVSASKYPFTFRLWADPQNGKAPKYHGLFVVDGPGQVFTLGLENSATIIYPPTTGNENWKLIAAPFSSSQQDDLVPTSPTPFSSVPFVMHAPSAYPSNISPNPTVTTTVYNPVGGGASGYHFQVRFWLPLTDPNFKHGRLYRTGGHYTTAGNPDTFTAGGTAAVRTSIGDWAGPTATGYTAIDHAACFTLESTVEAGWIIATLGPEWGTVASDGNNVIRLELGVALRLNSGGTDATETIVTTWPGGLDHYDVVLDATKSQLDAGVIDPTTLDPSLVQKPSGLGITTTNVANIVFNPSFETGDFRGWEIYQGNVGACFVQGGWNGPPFTVSGAYRAILYPSAGVVTLREKVGHVCRPGEVYYAELSVQNAFTTGTSVLQAEVLGADGLTRVAVGTIASLSNNTPSLTLISGTYTIPAGVNAAYVRLYLDVFTSDAGAFAIVDGAWLARQVSTGGGTEPDGKGGVKWKPGAGHKIGSDGSAEVNTGPGATINSSGQVVPNLAPGSSVGLNAFNQLVVPSGSLGNANFGAGLEAYGIYFGAPTGGSYGSAPNVIIDTSLSPWKVKRKNGSGGWTAATDPADIVAGTITALVAIQSPTINGGTVSGVTFTSTLNGITCEMNGAYDATFGGNVGIRVIRASNTNERTIVAPNCILLYDSNNRLRAVVSHGGVTLYRADGSMGLACGTEGISICDLNGYEIGSLLRDAPTNSAQLYLWGAGAKVSINGRLV